MSSDTSGNEENASRIAADAFILLIGEDKADLSYVKDEIKNTFI
jgi:hypothetical protein